MKPFRTARRGSTLSLVLCLYLALGSVLLGAVTMAATAGKAGERDYRRSQALALAEAGLAEARAGAAPHAARPLGDGSYSWSATQSGGDRIITARGEVVSPTSGAVTRPIRVRATGSGAAWKVKAWEEGP
ncbi:MAG: hypothetical protein ACO1SX_27635 [Actinomycetota bacterium]